MMNKKQKRGFVTFVIIASMAVGITACEFKSTPDATAQALIDRYAQTATAGVSSVDTISTTLEAAQQRATQTIAALQATRTLQVMATDANAKATQEAAAPVIAELPLYGIDPLAGKVGWIHPPAEVKADGYQDSAFVNQFPLVTARDFVIAADIEWDSRYGSAGCGFVVRANGDTEKPSQYMVAMTRLGTGHIFFAAQVDGEPMNYDSFYANGIDPKFEWDNHTTNRLVVVGHGKELTVYTNYTLIGTFDVTKPPEKPRLPEKPVEPQKPDIKRTDPKYNELWAKFTQALKEYQQKKEQYDQTVELINKGMDRITGNFDAEKVLLEEGFVGLFAFTSSGDVTCNFSNAWLWLVNE